MWICAEKKKKNNLNNSAKIYNKIKTIWKKIDDRGLHLLPYKTIEEIERSTYNGNKNLRSRRK